jgi:two-component system cell cycle response regulator
MSAHILIIEDNAANLELMRYLLHAFGYDAHTARGGADGIEQAKAAPPDLILCDVQMPGMDGYEVLRAMRAQAGLARLPVIAVTALAMVGDRDKALAAGFDGYLSKPIDPATFVQEIESFLPAGSRGVSSRASAARSLSQASHAGGAARGTILAVDNLQVNLDLLASIFESSGYRVVVTDSAETAIRLARESRPDLVMSDVCMPRGSGYELIRAFKGDPGLRDIPFVFITSTAMNESDRQLGLALGAAKFLFRPMEPQALLSEIESCLAPAGTR